MLAGVVLTLLAIGVAVWVVAGVGLLQLGSFLRGGQLHINVDQPTVVRQIRGLQRLETVSYTMDKIVSGERDNPILPQFLAADPVLLVVHGEAIAGVDLSKVEPGHVTVHGSSVRVHLPPAEIFTTTLDNAKTNVYSRDTGLFSSPDPNLEGEVREEAERQLRTAALDDGILKTADANARQRDDRCYRCCCIWRIVRRFIASAPVACCQIKNASRPLVDCDRLPTNGTRTANSLTHTPHPAPWRNGASGNPPIWSGVSSPSAGPTISPAELADDLRLVVAGDAEPDRRFLVNQRGHPPRHRPLRGRPWASDQVADEYPSVSCRPATATR